MTGTPEMFAALDGRDAYAWALACHVERELHVRRERLRLSRRSDEIQRAKWRAENRRRASRPAVLVERALRAARESLRVIERQARRAERRAA